MADIERMMHSFMQEFDAMSPAEKLAYLDKHGFEYKRSYLSHHKSSVRRNKLKKSSKLISRTQKKKA